MRSLHTCMCVYFSLSTQFCVAAHCCSFPELGQMTQTDPSASLWLHVCINEQIELETLRGTGSQAPEDPL